MRRIRTGATLVLLLAALALGCSRGQGQGTPSETKPVVDVELDRVRVGSIPEVLEATGRTKVLRQANIGSPVEGKITSLRVLEGDPTRRDAVIAVVQTKESLAAATGAELLVSRARTPEDKARAEQALERARQNETSIEVRAPFDGVVVSRAVNEGEFVTPGATLVTILDLKSLYFVAKIPARDLPHVHLGQEATVDFQSWPGKSYRCRVANIQSQIDPADQMAEVRLQFQSVSPELRSDLFGSVRIVVAEHQGVLIVPSKAVLRDDETGSHSVVEALGDSLGVIRAVRVGVQTQDAVEISGPGIRPGMHVVVEGHYGLPDSTRIRPAKAQDARG
jgi:RND family efflux transporter MFP subunit